MREILFRGKRVDSGKWVQGYYVYDDSEQLTEKPRADIVRLHEHPCGFSMLPFEVIPETVGQYTGLTDKNGKKIFEGDVCQTKGYKLIDETPFIVVWNDYYSGFYWEDVKNANDTDMFTKTVAELTEVIGNIHDNPELLKGGAE